jgi:hypothetical protein
LNIEERKQIFRYLLKSIFYDDCSEIEEGKLIDFYAFLLDSLETQSDHYVNSNNDSYFIIESIIQVLGQFHRMDPYILLHVIKNPNNFKEMVAEQTGLSLEYVNGAMEGFISDFQEIKQGYLFCS